MSSLNPAATEELETELIDSEVGSPTTHESASARSRLWKFLEQVADHANPILVKETRQALKSKQFIVTFIVVLIACWIASFAVVALVGPEIYYVAAGAQMLLVYALILAVPLGIIVPYTAFRSLAAEQEDNTYDLLSISTLDSSQIVTGKLMSAVVQMLVYLSAVSPCIAFTFLLRGVDALTVAVLLGYLVLGSLALSMIALLAGTSSRARYSQVLVSVLLMMLLLGCLSGSWALIAGYISQSYSFLRETWFWYSNLAFLTLYVTTFALLHTAASAQIAFSSENRSTPLRRMMLLQQVCFLGWLTVPAIMEGSKFLSMCWFLGSVFSGIYWYFMGSLMTSEWPHLSRRVQRSLPQSHLGRMFLTWLNPGPGTGYMFVVANLTMLAVGGMVLLYGRFNRAGGGPNTEQLYYFYALGWSYLVLYLGLGKLIIGVARRFAFVSLTAGFLVHLILLLFGCGGPQLLAYMTNSLWSGGQYTMLHITNPIWTLMELIDQGATAIDAPITVVLVGSTAFIVLLCNLPGVAVEIYHHRSALPERVAEDEAELHPEASAGPSNPWDTTTG